MELLKSRKNKAVGTFLAIGSISAASVALLTGGSEAKPKVESNVIYADGMKIQYYQPGLDDGKLYVEINQRCDGHTLVETDDTITSKPGASGKDYTVSFKIAKFENRPECRDSTLTPKDFTGDIHSDPPADISSHP